MDEKKSGLYNEEEQNNTEENADILTDEELDRVAGGKDIFVHTPDGRVHTEL